MNAYRSFVCRVIFGLGLLGAVTPLLAQDLGVVRQQMEQRLPALDEAKSAGHIGENNRGLVTARQDTAEIGQLVAAENADRLLVYAAIARKTGATPDAVAQARAKQIAAQSAAGIWLQKPNGDWYQK